MDTLFQKMLGGVGRLQENVGVTPFLKDMEKKTTSSHWQPMPGGARDTVSL